MAKMVAALLFASLVLALSPAAEATYAGVYGKVYCKENRSPVPGITVVLDCKDTAGNTVTKSGGTYSTSTDNNGRYSFGRVAGTSGRSSQFDRCTVTAAGYTEVVSQNGNKALKANQDYKENIALAPGATCPSPSPPPSSPPPNSPPPNSPPPNSPPPNSPPPASPPPNSPPPNSPPPSSPPPSPPPPSNCPVQPPPPAACPNNPQYSAFYQTKKLVENNSKAQYRFTAKLDATIPIDTVATIVLPPGAELTGKQCKFSDGKKYPMRKLLWYCDICVDKYTNTVVVNIGKVYKPSDSYGLAYDFTLKIKGLKGNYPNTLPGTLWTQCGTKYSI